MSNNWTKTEIKAMQKKEIAELAINEFNGAVISQELGKDAMVNAFMVLVETSKANAAADSQATPEPTVTPAASANKPTGEKYYKIKIPKQEGPDGKQDVKAGVNGRVWRIKRDMVVIVPERVIHVLDNAINTQLMVDSETGEKEVDEVPRISIFKMAEATEAEYKAFRAEALKGGK